MAKKFLTKKNSVLIILFIFLGSVIGGAIEYGFGNVRPALPKTNVAHNAFTQAEEYAVVSGGFVLLKFSVPFNCDILCQAEVGRIEGLVQKYAPYVFLEEVKEGTKMKIAASMYSGEREIDNVTAASVEETICLGIPLHPTCRTGRALAAIQGGEGSENASVPNISLGG